MDSARPKQVSRKYAAGFSRGDGLWRIAQLFEWMMMQLLLLFAAVTQLASQLSLLLVSSFLPGLPLPLTLEELHPLKWHVSSCVNEHETPTRFLRPGDKK